MSLSKICDAISVEDLRSCLVYDPETGVLTWKHRSDATAHWNRRYAGERAGRLHPSGYRRLSFRNRSVGEQRVIWAIVHGAWPDGLVDHINGDTADNRISNLRVVNSAQNSWNRACASRCKTGVKGVVRVESTGRFQASIMAGGIRRQLGSYATATEARAAYATAAAVLHGEFARTCVSTGKIDLHECRALRTLGWSKPDLAQRYGVGESDIGRACEGVGGHLRPGAFEFVRPAHPQEQRAALRLRQIGDLYAAGHRHSAIMRLTNLSKPTVSRHLALIRAGAHDHWAEGSRILLDREGA